MKKLLNFLTKSFVGEVHMQLIKLVRVSELQGAY
jgi:hypothetical protein